MVNKKGFTVIELLVAGVIATIVILATSRLLVMNAKHVQKAHNNLTTASTLGALGNYLSRNLPTGHHQLFAFSGLGPAERTLARVMIPQPSRCADLSPKAACRQDSAFIFASYSEQRTPGLSAICEHNAGILIDAAKPLYGVTKVSGATFSVLGDGFGVTPGPVLIQKNTAVALMTSPTGVILRALDRARRIVITYNPVTKVFTPALSAQCISQFRWSGPVPQIASIYHLPTEPWVLTQFTGGAAVTPLEVTQAIGAFPKKLVVPMIRSVGREGKSLGIRRCLLNTRGRVYCDRVLLAGSDNLQRVRVEQEFKVRLSDSAARRFDVKLGSMVANGTCALPHCQNLSVTAPGTIPVQSIAGESPANLDSINFSLMKQQLLSKITFKLTIGDTVRAIDVDFP